MPWRGGGRWRADGKATLWANGTQIGDGRIGRTVAEAFSSCAAVDVGRRDRGVFDLKPAHVSPEHDLRAHHLFQAVDVGVTA